jgi:hypothetical protein
MDFMVAFGDMRSACITFLSALAALSAATSGHSQQVTTYGYAGNYCSDFLAAVGSAPIGQSLYLRTAKGEELFDKKHVYLSWAYGYVSAYNRYNSNAQVRGDLSTRLDAELRKYCTDNPSSLFLNAVHSIVEKLKTK